MGEGPAVVSQPGMGDAAVYAMETQNEAPPAKTCKAWCLSYFWEGQQLGDSAQEKKMDPNASFFTRHRRLLSMVIPGLIAHIIWWSIMIANDLWHIFTEESGKKMIPNWYMCITMVFGSMIAGATSEGGASIAFPVMTLVFDIAPAVARDFSFMIQSAGMTAAATTIGLMGVAVEKHALFYCTLSGVAGIIFGLEEVAPRLEPPQSKMYFVSIWFAFAFSLYWLNRMHGRRVHSSIPEWELGRINLPFGLHINWKACALLTAGFIGGIFSAMAGSGIDICSFAVLTLFFRVSEKVATPTSVVLMACNTVVGFLYREFGMGGVKEDAWGFFTVCVPIVVIGAPLGSLIGSHFHRLVLASFVYVTDTVQLIGALYVVQPWTTTKTDTPLSLSITSACIIIFGAIFFRWFALMGQRQLAAFEERERAAAKRAAGVVPSYTHTST